jgi:hypothetical protein
MHKQITQALVLDNWPRRRRWMKIVLIWAMGNAQYILIFGKDSGLFMNAFLGLLTLIAAIIGSYVFGAIWDDTDKRRRCFPDMTQVDTSDPTVVPQPTGTGE